MCLNTNFQNFNLKSVSKNSDSFDDRFCDDLCEEILQYLPLKDKMRFESVSKQFQRTVYRRNHEFNLMENERKVIFARNVHVELSDEFKILNSIDSVLKKCPNIMSIDLTDFSSINDQILRQMLQIITKYCNNLNEIKVKSFKSNDCKEFQEFCLKFGSKLKKIYGFECFNDLNLFPNLRSLDLKTDNSFHIDDIYHVNSKRVKELNLIVVEGKEYVIHEVLQKFNEIRHLTLGLKTKNQKSVFNGFKDSPLLKNLIELKLETKGEQISDFIINCLKQMEKKFPNLKSIKFCYGIQFVFLKNTSGFEQLMSSLKAFPHLKRLQIRLNFMADLDFEKNFSFNYFPQELTHLRIAFFRQKLNVLFLNDIDIYLPKLQFLSILSPMTTDKEEEVTQMADILSRLSRLQKILLWFNTKIDRELIREKIIEKCPKIKRLILL